LTLFEIIIFCNKISHFLSRKKHIIRKKMKVNLGKFHEMFDQSQHVDVQGLKYVSINRIFQDGVY
jgi:hypothetical protein